VERALNKTVLISGAGIAGPTLAYWLSRYDFISTMIERAPVFRTGGYILDFWGVGFDVAERMDLIPRLKDAGYEPREVRIVDDTGRRIGGFCTDRLRQALSDRLFSTLRGDLSRNIFETVAARVETVFGDSMRALHNEQNGVAVEFEHSPSRHFDLVIGAENRARAARPQRRERTAGRSAGRRYDSQKDVCRPVCHARSQLRDRCVAITGSSRIHARRRSLN
jgi:2-polyprenyl-6-methoxyphenol hydroxylase-like FAD-dependent oxidoreductase